MSSRISNIVSKINKQSTASKAQSGSVNPTIFERDFISVAKGKKGVKNFQSQRSMTVAQACVDNLKKKSGEITDAYTFSTETASGERVLTPIYKRFMCGGGGRCNGDAKSDVVLQTEKLGKMTVSMKKQGEAQIASAQAGEAAAVISAALQKDREIIGEIRGVITEILSRNSYYTLRNQYEQKYGINSFNQMVGELLGIKTGVASPSVSDITKFNGFLKRSGMTPRITAALSQYMSSPATKKKLFMEFASGEKRFIKSQSDRVAKWMLTWSDAGTITLNSVDSFVSARLGSFRFNVRDRGDGAGGSLRLAIREQMTLDAQEYKNFLVIEKNLMHDLEHAILTEGILDTAVDLVKTAGSAVANLYKGFVKAMKKILSMVSRLFAKGMASVLDFFGLEVEEMQYTW